MTSSCLLFLMNSPSRALFMRLLLVCTRRRFCQPGRKLVPGAGLKFHHVHRTSGPGTMELRQKREPRALVGQEINAAEQDDEDELPWQVCMTRDERLDSVMQSTRLDLSS